jgi:hypothetical protein
MVTKIKSRKIAKANLSLCAGSYTATRIAQTVVVSATGVHATSGFSVFLEQTPIDVFPPEFALWHKAPSGPVLDVITPFSASAHFATTDNVKAVVLHDADGAHIVNVRLATDQVHAHTLATVRRSSRRARGAKPSSTSAVKMLAATSAVVGGCVQVWIHLEPILKSWCGAPTIFPSDSLETLWTQGPTGKPYDPLGINKLRAAIQADPFFASCPEAKALQLVHFQKGGEIQTAGDLLNHLCPCGS